MSQQSELLEEFLVEVKEHLDHLDEELLALETSPSDSSLIHSIFRRLHTIKGVCGFLSFYTLEKVSHAGETLLDKLRDGELEVDEHIINLLLRLNDAIRTIISSIESTGSECSERFEAITNDLLAAAKVPASPITSSTELSLDEEFEALLDKWDAEEAEQSFVEPGRLSALSTLVESNQAVNDATDNPVQAAVTSAHKEAAQQKSLRVDVTLLDDLMNLAGELVLTRNQILQTVKCINDPHLKAITQRLNLVTSELQEGVMRTRMQPISAVWSKFPRVVRELALTCKKRVQLVMHGKETELDKTLIEAIRDPLTHILRNAVDHGIESPERREAAGKSAEGCITISAFQEGGYVIIEVVDDGAGLNTDKIRQLGIERGLLSREQASTITDSEIHQLIFAPGFSTSDTVTNLSGRGVGMDVVKSSIEGIGGHVDITSTPGEGSNIRLKVPLTLVILPALLFSCRGQRFAIPQSGVTELVRLDSSDATSRVSWIGTSPFYTLREELIPLVFLDQHLNMTPAPDATWSDRVVAIVDVDGRRFGIVVDKVHDTAEIVVKPLGRILRKMQIYAGATILGNGDLALIIDPLVLARDCRIDRAEQERKQESESVSSSASIPGEQLLVAQVSQDLRIGIPLSLVERLEEFSPADIEHVGDTAVVQYRGSILRLIDVASALGATSAASEGGSVVVLGQGDDAMGLQIQRILDVSGEITAITPVKDQPGIISYGVIQGQVTALVDLNYLLAWSAGAHRTEISSRGISI